MQAKDVVWLVSQYEPAAGGGFRPLRSHYLAQNLLARGYEVIQWSACFSHQARDFVAQPWEEREIAPGWKVVYVPNSAYKGNVGRDRLASEAQFAKDFYNRAVKERKPKCIVVREPPLVLGEAAVRYGRENRVAVISDVIDLWPEMFHRVLPQRVRALGRAVFAPLYARRRRMWSSVDGLCAVSQAYVDHAIKEAPALRQVPTARFYTSIERSFVRDRLARRSELIEDKVGAKPEGEVWVGYAGSLGTAYDVPVILEAAERLREKSAPVRFVMAGMGPFAETFATEAEKPGSNITFLGMLPPDDLYPMLGKCDLGLLSYAADSPVAIPDKFYDYVAAGLPIVNSLQGEVRTLIESKGLGVTYAPGDAKGMVAAIESLAADPGKRAEIRRNEEAAAEEWDAPKHFSLFADFVEKIIASKA